MNFFNKAVTSHCSTILYGSFGRYPKLVQFYLESFPELEYASEYELIFWYLKSRLLYVILEPPFNSTIPADKWCLVLTSHPRLFYNSQTTRLIYCEQVLEKEIPFPLPSTADQERIIPPTSHMFSFFNYKPSRIDLTGIKSTHEAYLRLLTFFDCLLPSSQWSLTISKQWRQALLKDIPDSGIYDTHLLKILG